MLDDEKENFLNQFNDWEKEVRSGLPDIAQAYYLFNFDTISAMFNEGKTPAETITYINERLNKLGH